jgi:hypothetical protein
MIARVLDASSEQKSLSDRYLFFERIGNIEISADGGKLKK